MEFFLAGKRVRCPGCGTVVRLDHEDAKRPDAELTAEYFRFDCRNRACRKRLSVLNTRPSEQPKSAERQPPDFNAGKLNDLF